VDVSGREVETVVDVLPLYGQIEIADRDAVEVPQWETGDEPAVFNDAMICVATRSDADGRVCIVVASDSVKFFDKNEIFAGELSLPSGVLVVGNSVASQITEIDLSPATSIAVRVYVEPLDLPTRVMVAIA
jgi:hypothetical protein